MALKRVPGVSKNYLANDDGFKQISRSQKMQAEMMESGREIAGVAASAGKSEYGVNPATVTVGWDNERRAGATVFESKYHPADWRDSILKRTAAAMARRGGGR